MSKCSISYYNGAINDASLYKIDEIKIKIASGTNPVKLGLILNSNKTSNLRLVGDADFIINGTNQGKSYTTSPFANTTVEITAATSDSYVFIDNKENIFQIQTSINGTGYDISRFCFDIENIQFCLGIKKLLFYATANVIGDITSLYDKNLTEYNFSNTKINGDVANLAKSTSGVNIKNTQVTGTIESFVARKVELGYDSGSTLFDLAGANITFAGNSYGGAYLAWESATKIALYSGYSVAESNIVRVSGYTDEEIATNKAAGGIWEGKTVWKVD